MVTNGIIRDISYDGDDYLSMQTFGIGIYCYAAAANVLGLDARDHSRFLIDRVLSRRKQEYQKAAEFSWNESGENMAAEKIDYLIAHPELRLIADTGIGETRTMWPGAIRVPFFTGINKISPEIIIANSGVPAYLDVVLVAAFALGINAVDSRWGLDNFQLNRQYTLALRQAAHLYLLYHDSDMVVNEPIVEGEGWSELVFAESDIDPKSYLHRHLSEFSGE